MFTVRMLYICFAFVCEEVRVEIVGVLVDVMMDLPTLQTAKVVSEFVCCITRHDAAAVDVVVAVFASIAVGVLLFQYMFRTIMSSARQQQQQQQEACAGQWQRAMAR